MRFPVPRMSAVVALATVACLSTDPSGPADALLLRTDATTYEWRPNVPPPAMTPSLRNTTRSDLGVRVCGGPTVLTRIVYEQKQSDGSWTPIALGTFTCAPASVQELVIPGGSVSPVPPGRLLPALLAGTYRIKLAWGPRGQPDADTVISNSYVVQGSYQP